MLQKIYVLLFILVLISGLYNPSYSQTASLIINEVSQGNGTQEYVELLVVSDQPNSCIRPTLDLRKWVIDDNNGYFAAGSGTGIADGSMRFANNSFWANVPVGTLILIYNQNSFNSSKIPPVDNSLTDGNCRLVLPANSSLFEKNGAPTISNGNYPATGWSANGDWETVAMRNDGDAFQIYNSGNLTTPVHGVAWGNNNLHQDIYFSGTAGGLVFSFTNTVSDDYHNQNNWSSGAVASNETPGLPNSTKNEIYINSLSNNCSSAPSPITLPVLQTSIVKNTTCNKPNGELGSTVSGGTSPFTYSWSNGATTSDLEDVASGTYTLIVTDASGCKDTSEIILPASSAPDITLTPVHTSCANDNGSISSAVTGGTAPYTYEWSNAETTSSISGLAGGNYQLIVTDNTNCKDTAQTTINTSTAIAIDTNLLVHTSCGLTNGELSVNVTGGSGTYTYSWSNGASTSALTNLNAGTYTVTVTDNTGCSASRSFAVNPSSGITVSTTSVTHTTCNQSNGAVSVNVTGGQTPYTFSWSNSASTQNISNIAAGTYNVTVTDANGCQDTLNAAVVINSSAAPDITLTPVHTSCANNNGSISSAVTGGAAPYTYQWSNGQTASSTNGLTSGTYQLIVTDNNNCKDTAQTTINASSLPNLQINTTPTSCGLNNGGISASVSGGIAPYTYSWSNGQTGATLQNLPAGNYSVSVEDANGCTASAQTTVNSSTGPSVTVNVVQQEYCNLHNGAIQSTVSGGTAPYTYLWSGGQTTANIQNLDNGSHSLVVTDQSGCQITSNTVQITDQAGFTIQGQTIQPTCQSPSGSIILSENGGTAPFTYQWSNGSISSSISNLAPGNYTVTVTDASGCQRTESFTINAAASIDFTVNTTAASCEQNDGTASVEITNGNGPFSFTFSSGQNTPSATNLAPGNYTVTVSNNDGCTSTRPFVISQNNTIGVDIESSKNVLEEGENAILTATVSPSGLNVTYAWNPKETLSCPDCPNPTATPTADTWYILTVTTASGCSGVDSVLIAFKKECGEAYVPNMFSPNNDGNNDVFVPKGKCIVKGMMLIYNRWGELIYRTDDIYQGWDGTQNGKEVNSGVYVYKIDLVTEEENTLHLNGSVTLVR